MEKKYTKIILDKIKEYDSIIIMRHTRPDGDAVGSTMGLRQILRLSYPEKKIRLINSDYSDYVAFLENEDKDVSDNIYKKSLGIVIDTGDVKRISNKKYGLCKELIKIDHHIDHSPYGGISWVEEERASACEMIAQFYFDNEKELKIDSFAATAIYTGMITDTGRFKYGVTNSSPFTYAGKLMDLGIDVELLYAYLYAQSFDEMKYKAFVLRNMKITENGVAYVYISRATQKKYGLNHEEASNCVSYMENIKGSLIWLGFIDNEDKTTRVRLRSRFVTVNEIAEKYSGGGHARASGATVHSKEEMNSLIALADETLKQYKKKHKSWI
ncbi:MAG: bifunctional oligoribonuclease/PAP phosphatase NrnA [Clostridiales bacterium]|nr:bifunctional oligoribonuclease/PAP phosphatase NrnA [Clostridiales bacterium]